MFAAQQGRSQDASDGRRAFAKLWQDAVVRYRQPQRAPRLTTVICPPRACRETKASSGAGLRSPQPCLHLVQVGTTQGDDLTESAQPPSDWSSGISCAKPRSSNLRYISTHSSLYPMAPNREPLYVTDL